jgi:hypothetical protein
MNERIKELYKQAGMKFYGSSGNSFDIREFNPEKFSELLITAVMAEVRDEVQYEYDWTIADIVTERVKKAFGVTQ